MYITYKGYKCLLKDYDNIKYTNGGIPKIIIKTSWHKRNNIPVILNNILKNIIFINPEYKLYYFDDDEIEEFMKFHNIEYISQTNLENHNNLDLDKIKNYIQYFKNKVDESKLIDSTRNILNEKLFDYEYRIKNNLITLDAFYNDINNLMEQYELI